MAKNNRRKKFIDSKVQGALCRRIVFHYAVFFVASCMLAFFLQILANPLLSFKEHFSQLWGTYGPLILVAVCLLPVFIRDTIGLSHRFVGPILRIRNTIQQAGAGKDTPLVRLRPGDFWMDLADDLNGLLTRINGKSAAREQTEELVS